MGGTIRVTLSAILVGAATEIMSKGMGLDEIGPVDYAIVSFRGNKLTGQIAPALEDLVKDETIRIIDAVFVKKDESGETVWLEFADTEPEVQAAFERAGFEVTGLFSDEDLKTAAEELEPGSSAMLLVWENLWARRIYQAVRDADGELTDFGRIPHDVVQAARKWALETAQEEA